MTQFAPILAADPAPTPLASPWPRAPPPVKLDLRHVSFRYGHRLAVDDVSMPVYANRVTALIGPSGCGKSTLLRIFNRMYERYPHQRAEGKALLDGVNVIGHAVGAGELRARVGMVFQSPMSFAMSIFDNVAYGARLYRDRSRQELNELVERSLRRAALWDEVKAPAASDDEQDAPAPPARAAALRMSCKSGRGSLDGTPPSERRLVRLQLQWDP